MDFEDRCGQQDAAMPAEPPEGGGSGGGRGHLRRRTGRGQRLLLPPSRLNLASLMRYNLGIMFIYKKKILTALRIPSFAIFCELRVNR